MGSDIILWVPSRTDYVHVLRTVAASACASFDLSIDDIADVRLAVTEAASELMSIRPGGDLRMRLSNEGPRVRVTVSLSNGGSDEDARNARSPSDTQDSLAWQVLKALGDDVRIVDDEAGIGITFAKARPHGA